MLRVANYVPLLVVLCSLAAAAEDNWPQFRGPRGDGTSDATGLPTKWSETQNVKWKTPIPGLAHSSPVVWGDRVFITTAVAKGDASVPFLFGDQSTSVAGSTKVAASS